MATCKDRPRFWLWNLYLQRVVRKVGHLSSRETEPCDSASSDKVVKGPHSKVWIDDLLNAVLLGVVPHTNNPENTTQDLDNLVGLVVVSSEEQKTVKAHQKATDDSDNAPGHERFLDLLRVNVVFLVDPSVAKHMHKGQEGNYPNKPAVECKESRVFPSGDPEQDIVPDSHQESQRSKQHSKEDCSVSNQSGHSNAFRIVHWIVVNCPDSNDGQNEEKPEENEKDHGFESRR